MVKHEMDQWHMGYNTIYDTISPPNKDNIPITNMQLAQGSISRVQSTTNYEGDGVDLGDSDGDGDGADVDGDGDASSHA